jgi:ATP/maltotriose-dependent transcriptional regulator MalT/DNA-binding SARP family transcriptional activator
VSDSPVRPGAVAFQVRTPATKVLPPALPAAWVERPGLLARLDHALDRRLTTVVAGPGYGKSSLLASWAATVRAAWYGLEREDAALPVFVRGLVEALRLRLPGLPPDVTAAVDVTPGPDGDEGARADGLAAVLGEVLEQRLDADLVLVLDDVQEIAAGGPPARLVEALCRHAPPGFHLVLCSRAEPPFPVERLRGRGQVLELDGARLAFTQAETAALLAAVLPGDAGVGEGSAERLAGPLHEMTGGWPAATCLAAETLRHLAPRERMASLAALRRPGGRIFAYLAGEAFAREDPAVRELVKRMAPFGRFTAGLCLALGVEADAALLTRLARDGLFLESRPVVDGWFVLGGLVREFALASLPLAEEERRELYRAAAGWFAANGHPSEALEAVAALGDDAALAGYLVEHGPATLAAGAVAGVVAAAARLPAPLRSPAVEQLEGQARQVQGDWQGALECFRRAAGGADRLHPGLAWRLGLIHHFRGDLDEALATYGRGRIDDGTTPDEALLLAWTSTAHWLRGEVEACRAAATAALAAAGACGDQQALAAAHTTMAMLSALEGDRAGNDANYLRALEAAEQAHDVLQLARIRTNRGSRAIEEGFHAEALAELEIAVRLAELAGFAPVLGLALSNRGEAHLGHGRLDEAVADFETAKATFQRIGSSMVAYPLAGLGDVYRERGDLALARAAYEEAVALAERSGDLQGLVPAQAGLAQVLAGDEPRRARKLAEQAVGHGPGMSYVAAQLAAGWVTLARGERRQAARLADAAARTARSRRDRVGIATALELRAMAAAEPAAELARLGEAATIWAAVGNQVGQARNALAVARLEGADGAAVERAEARLRALGVRVRAEAGAGLLHAVAAPALAPVQVQALGGFRVLRAGVPVGAEEWRSRKARDLLKLLISRRGRPTTRELAMEALWPGEAPERLSNRLSVALSTVRAVLDPERRLPPDRFVAADKHVLWLADLAVDVEEFLAAARAGLAAAGTPAAVGLLTTAEAAYAGDYLEDDPYDDWAVPLREEAREAYVAVARALARLAAQAGEHDRAVRYHLRVLEHDVYDEEAHLGLARVLSEAGRHGEARRRYRLYTGRMAEIGVEAAPFPGGRRAALPAGAAPGDPSGPSAAFSPP